MRLLARLVLPSALAQALALPTHAATIRVPEDQPTLAAALGAATSGDVVDLNCGEYFAENLDLPSGIVLRSRTGDPDCVCVRGTAYPYAMRITDAQAGTSLVGIDFCGGAKGLNIQGSNVFISDCRF